MWSIKLKKEAKEDLEKLKAAGLLPKIQSLLEIVRENPFTPPYEKLGGDLKGYYSRRITIKHRLVYSVEVNTKNVTIIMMWSHYSD